MPRTQTHWSFCDRDAFLKQRPDPHTRKITPPSPGMIYARDIWNRIIASAHKYAEPGIAFIDEVNRHNHMMASMGPIYSCNPCGEQFLHANNSCNLGSIDVSKFHDTDNRGRRNINWNHLRHVVHASTQFLDNVIDTCTWPLPEIEDTVKRTRPIGLGIMGFADLCLKLSITYGSPESCALDGRSNGLCTLRSLEQEPSARRGKRLLSLNLKRTGTAYHDFIYDTIGIPPDSTFNSTQLRNNHLRTDRHNLARCRNLERRRTKLFLGLRPQRHDRDSHLRTSARRRGSRTHVDQTDQDSIERAAAYVVEHLTELPPHFISAMDISSEQHVHVLAATQRNVDNSVSKTCNGAKDDTLESVSDLYMLARQLGCKAVSYYRDGSRDEQVLTSMKKDASPRKRSQIPYLHFPNSLKRLP